MRITGLEILKVPPSWVWLRIHTDEGMIGLGEPFLENHGDSVIAEVRRLEPLLIGQDPLRRQSLWAAMYEGGNGYRGGPVTLSAISGIDMALWDIAGQGRRSAGLPTPRRSLYRERIRVYRSVGPEPPYCVEPGLAVSRRTPGTSRARLQRPGSLGAHRRGRWCKSGASAA